MNNVAEQPTFIEHIVTGDKTWVYEYDIVTANDAQNRSRNQKQKFGEAYNECMEILIKRWHAVISSKAAYFEGANKYWYFFGSSVEIWSYGKPTSLVH